MKYLNDAITAYNQTNYKFFKYVSQNDAGKGGGHQSGLYVPKSGSKLMFEKTVERGKNMDRITTINWFDGTKSSNCRFIYYGKGTRNEYRITRLSKQFILGNLVIIMMQEDSYQGFVLSEESDINFFKEQVSNSK